MRHTLFALTLLLLPALAGAENLIGIRATVAGAAPYNESPEIGGGFDWRIEDDTGFWEADLGIHFGLTHDSNAAAWVGFGRSFYLGDFYLGGAPQVRWVFDGAGDDGIGCAALGVAGQVGYMFMHDRSTRMYVEARAVQNLTPFGCSDGLNQDRESTRSHWRTEFALAVGVGF
jgi:hypothetical protein